MLVTLAGQEEGGAPVSKRPAAAQPPPKASAKSDLRQSDAALAETPPASVESPEAPTSLTSLAETAVEVFDPAPSEPDFTAEPDPATTGDVAATVVGAALSEAGVQCPLSGVLRETLERDEVLQASLANIPPQSRSVANAVLLWDGRWLHPERLGGRITIDIVRDAVAAGLEDASEACRAQVILGPVFLPIQSRSGPLVLAMGSGAWRWEDLLETEALEEPARRLQRDRPVPQR